MIDAANVWRRTRTTDAGGGYASTWTQVGTTPMEAANASASERRIAAQEGVEITHTLNVPLGTDLRRGDRLVANGTTYEVVSPEPSTLATVLKLRAKVEPWDEPTE